jgi:translation elongation factor EF-4
VIPADSEAQYLDKLEVERERGITVTKIHLIGKLILISTLTNQKNNSENNFWIIRNDKPEC